MGVTTTDRDLNKLNSNFKKKVDAFMNEAWDTIFITEARRSQARQDYLYSLWRTKPWKIVTRTLNSLHTKGLAIDIAFKWKDLYPNEIDKRLDIYKVAEKHWIDSLYKLEWFDKPHLQCNWKPFIPVWPKIWKFLKVLLNYSVILLKKYRHENKAGRDDIHKLANYIREFIKKYG